MKKLKPFDYATLENISKILMETLSFDDHNSGLLTNIFKNFGLVYKTQYYEWADIYNPFSKSQKETGSPDKILAVVQFLLDPKRFANRRGEFERHRRKLNNVLMMVGLQFCKDGKIIEVEIAATLDEVEERMNAADTKLNVLHEEVEKYCEEELKQENYVHAAFEATKGLSQRIRELSGAKGDGAKLIDTVFSEKNPLLKINKLETDTDRSEHFGFAMLLKGCIATLRNPIAHAPKILWKDKDDAADYLSFISLLHRKLDKATRTKPKGT